MAKKEAKAKKENNKNKKSFFKDFKAELKKVSWLTPKQLANNTVAVITIVFITAIIVFVLDLGFETLNKHGVEKIKEVITANSTEENTESSDDATVQNDQENKTEEANETTVEEQNTTTEEQESNTNNNAE